MTEEVQTTIDRLTKEREEARDLAWKYRGDIRRSVSQELWEKYWRDDTDTYPWLYKSNR